MSPPERPKEGPGTPFCVVLSLTLACEILKDLRCVLLGLDIYIPPFCRLRALFFLTQIATMLPTTICIDLPPFCVPLGVPGGHDFVIFALQFPCEILHRDLFGDSFNKKVTRRREF